MNSKLRKSKYFNNGVLSAGKVSNDTKYSEGITEDDKSSFRLGVAEGKRILHEGRTWENAELGDIWVLELLDKVSDTYVFMEYNTGLPRFYPVNSTSLPNLGLKATLIISGKKIWPVENIDWS